MLLRIPGSAREDSGNVSDDFEECSRRFRGMFKKVPENVPGDSGECY